MKNRTRTTAVLLALLLLGFVSVWKLQERLDTQRKAARLQEEGLLLRSPNLVKRLSLEYAPLAAALYWTGAVQYFGEKHRLHERNFDLLWPLLDITTTLDPNLTVAYRFGSSFLSEPLPRGAGMPDKAVELLERGIAANPDYWRYYQDLGNVYYFDLKDYAKASAAFERGSRLPGAMDWMKVMAAKIAEEGESLETSAFLWKEIYTTTKIEEIRKNAESHLKVIQAQMDIRELDRLSAEFAKRTGHPPTSFAELISAGMLRGIPKDADGFPYEMDSDGKSDINRLSPIMTDKLLFERYQPPK